MEIYKVPISFGEKVEMKGILEKNVFLYSHRVSSWNVMIKMRKDRLTGGRFIMHAHGTSQEKKEVIHGRG